MKVRLLCALALVAALGGCATGSVSPIQAVDAPANRVYWDNFAGDGYRIKISRDDGQMGSLCYTEVFVDGKHAADIGLAETAMFKVSPGPHTLRAAPTVASSTCKAFYSGSQFQTEVTVNGAPGDVKSFRYGFSGSGLPFLSPTAG